MTAAPAKPYLPAVIEWVKRGMAMATALSEKKETDRYRRTIAMRHLVDALGMNMERKFGARVGQRGDLVTVECCGIRASSVQGLTGALRNWITAAEKKAATTATAAQMGATLQ
ncbi:hypothetical protein [Novosphingobium sp. FSW06-99]|uniref:hypothetical protein n=1 Tax=Novosphingobium sp. FSW06-99 TaxID=1739113 RepID=UPI00076BFE92|nr:hypothetical protein [Novosphingobium sp. FSW06-99]KUR80941.1 hypothetical protein AQZ49_02645 [Novosphingobium sp. FSW06-99]